MKNSVTILFLVALAMVAFLPSACLASSGKESDSSMKQETKISFRLTKAGEPYDLKLLSGYDNPYAIKDALHSLLYSQPYKLQSSNSNYSNVYLYTAKDSDQKLAIEPCVDAEQDQTPSAKDLGMKELSALKPMKYGTAMFMRNEDERLSELCALLSKDQDCIAIKNEIKRLGAGFGLSFDNAHDWVCTARSRKPSLVLMRNPSPVAMREKRAAAAGMTTAWQIEKSPVILYELEESWCRVFALQILEQAKAKPLGLASAAILSRKHLDARTHYQLALAEKGAFAKSMLDRMTYKPSMPTANQKNIQIPASNLPKSSYQGWKPVLKWLPTDSELLMVGQVSTSPIKLDEGNDAPQLTTLFAPMVIEPDGDAERENQAYMEANKLLINTKVAFALHSARTFYFGGGIGVGSGDGISVLMLDKANRAVTGQVIRNIEKDCIYRERIENVDILCFENLPFTLGTFLGSTRDDKCVYVCMPLDGVLLVANNSCYLQETLRRMKDENSSPAFDDSLPEWNYVDKSMPFWALRHYDKSYVPFDAHGMYELVTATFYPDQDEESLLKKNLETGLTFSSDGKTCYLHIISGNDALLKNLGRRWQGIFGYHYENEALEKARFKGSFEIKDGVLTFVEVPDDYRILPLQLLVTLGYFVAI
ncbi:MAG: hypothetical protein R3F51_09185 [Cyanobacteriota/Melainabacteria group bacterium]